MTHETLNGLADHLYAEADKVEALAREIRARAVMLRLTHERSLSQQTVTETLYHDDFTFCQPGTIPDDVPPHTEGA